MPEIFNLFGYSFFFWSKEHEPIHVHVEGSDGYATFDWDERSEAFIERECFNISGMNTLTNKAMKINRIWFDSDYIYGSDESGKIYRQSLLWYPALKAASDEERLNYRFGFRGVHWRNLDEDISFDSFMDEDAEPSALQRFFLTHKEIKISEFAKIINIDATLLRNYINGFKKPSKEREQLILGGIHALANQYASASF